MPPLYMLLSAIALPLFLTAGAIAAIHFSRNAERRQAQPWRDTSLDDWRSNRGAAIEAERAQRAASGTTTIDEGQAEEKSEPVRQHRIGG